MNKPLADHWPYPFSPQDWQGCLTVLQAALQAPDEVPELEQFKTLVSGVYKQARKDRRKQNQQARQQHDQQLIASSARVAQELSGTSETQAARPAEATDERLLHNRLLYKGKHCYCCHRRYQQVDAYYHRLCPDCAALNHDRREQMCDLSGRIALITGGRIKIGYATALRLLRQGAEVWVTSRFPAQAAAQFAQESDFASWRSRLQLIGLDLLNLGALETLIQELQIRLTHLDLLINNAALTLWQPPAYYQPLLEREQHLLTQAKALGLLALDPVQSSIASAIPSAKSDKTQTMLLPGLDNANIPLSRHTNQHSPSTHNSWQLELEQIPAREMLEVQVINQIAPMMLCAQLKPLMLRSPFEWRWIVNVTAIEGQFSDPLKQSKHAHTNAAKAGLNMLTRTAASAYAQDRILMNAVDPGWVSNDQHATRDALTGKQAHKVPPLAYEDAAARICAPIVDSLQGQPIWGKLLKNYQPIDW